MRERVIRFNEAQAQRFCTRLWLELTVAGRSLWSDPDLSPATQLNGLKLVNEIQHRVWGAYSCPGEGKLAVLLEQIVAACEQAPELGAALRSALDRAVDAADDVADAQQP